MNETNSAQNEQEHHSGKDPHESGGHSHSSGKTLRHSRHHSHRKHRPASPANDMLAAALITFAFAAGSFEKYVPKNAAELYMAGLFIAFAAAWISFMFSSGKKKKYAFPIFTVLFWIIPFIIIYLADNGPELFRMSIPMYVLSEFLSVLIRTPLSVIGGVIGVPDSAALILIFLACAGGYMCGIFASLKTETKKR